MTSGGFLLSTAVALALLQVSLSAGAEPVVSFRDDAVVPHVLSFGGNPIGAGSLLDLQTGAVILDEGLVFGPGVEDIDAVHVMGNGELLFSTTTAAFIDGVSYSSGDVVRYDPSDGAHVLAFSVADFSEPTTSVDAIHRLTRGPHAGRLLLSTATVASLGGLVVRPGDLVAYDAGSKSAALVFDQDLISGTQAQQDVDAVHVLRSGDLLLSIALSGGSLGGLTLEEHDLILYDPLTGVASVALAGDGLFDGTTADINALSLDPVQLPAFSLAGVLILGLALFGSGAGALTRVGGEIQVA